MLLAQRLGIASNICRETIRQALRKARYTYQRVQEFTPGPDPDYKRKKRLRSFAVRFVDRPGWAVLFQDETGNFSVKPRTGYNWMPGNERNTVPEVKEKRRRAGVYGVLDTTPKRVYWKCTTSRTAKTTIAFLKSVLGYYCSKKYIVII